MNPRDQHNKRDLFLHPSSPRDWISNTIDRIGSILLLLTVLLTTISPYSDFDWGWHYRYGEYFFKTFRVLRADPFSWTLPGYIWTNHSWLYDPILYLLYKAGGFTLLSLAGALVTTAIFVILLSPFRLPLWAKAVLAYVYIHIEQLGFEQGLRSQLVSLLFLSALMALLIRFQKTHRLPKLLPLLFLLWANFHGMFVLGLLTLTTFLVTDHVVLWRQRPGKATHRDHHATNLKWNIAVFAITISVTLLNPFTYRVYAEALRHSSNPWLHYVIEWLPLNGCGSCYIPILVGLIIFLFTGTVMTWNSQYVPFIITTTVFFIMTLSARRYITIGTITALPFTALMLERLPWQLPKIKILPYVVCIVLLIVSEIATHRVVYTSNIFHYTLEDYCVNSNKCSVRLSEFLKQEPPQGKGFNFYDWGGFFIGTGVPLKVFIDGRMHLWGREGYMPFADYIPMYYWGNKDIFNRYNFPWVIVRNDSQLVEKLQSTQEFGTWKLRYSDAQSSYFIRMQ